MVILIFTDGLVIFIYVDAFAVPIMANTGVIEWLPL